jgi:Holliday junction resolvase
MLESKIQNKILAYLNSLNYTYVIKVISANKRGVPDIIGCYKGKFFAIETKTNKGVVSDLQKLNIQNIKEAKGAAIVARSLEDVIVFIKLLEEN